MAHLLLFGHSECVAPPLFPPAQRHEEGCRAHPRPVPPKAPSREAYQDATGRVLGEIAGMDVDPASRVGTEDPEGARLADGWAGPHGVLNLLITDRKALVALKAFEDRQREVPPLEPASGPLGSGLVGHHGQVNRVAMKQEHHRRSPRPLPLSVSHIAGLRLRTSTFRARAVIGFLPPKAWRHSARQDIRSRMTRQRGDK